jgi:hypothetical protein
MPDRMRYSSMLLPCFLLIFTETVWCQSTHPASLEPYHAVSKLWQPGTLSIQGAIQQKNKPVADGSYAFSFRLYESALSDIPIWTENQTGVPVYQGIFHAILGKSMPFNIPFDKPYFLGIKWENEPEMDPRIELTSVPYAFAAASVPDQSISVAKIQMAAITNEKIAPNAVTLDKIQPNILSGINGIINDGGHINLVAGSNVSITADALNKNIIISAVAPGAVTGISSLNESENISITNPTGPIPTIRLKPQLKLGPEGVVELFNRNLTRVGIFGYNSNQGGFFNLSNESGTELFRMSTGENQQGRLRMQNRLGNRTAELMSNDFSDGELTLYSVLTNPTIRITATEGAGGLINLFNSNSILAARLAETNGHGHFNLFNAEGKEMVKLYTLNGAGWLNLNNNLGSSIVSIQSSEFSDGQIWLRSVLQTPTLFLGANDNAGGSIQLYSQKEKISGTWTEKEGVGDFKLMDARNNEMVHLGQQNFAGALDLRNSDNKLITSMKNSGIGSSLTFFDGEKNENKRVEVQGTPLGGYLSIQNRNTSHIAYLGVNPENQQGLLEFPNKAISFQRMLRMGGDASSRGFIQNFNQKAKLTFDLGHNEFHDGELKINNNLGHPGAVLTGYQDGGLLVISDGAPGLNHRATVGNSFFGGRLALFNFSQKLAFESGIQKSGEGLLRIVNPDEIITNRIELGGSNQKDGFIHSFDSKNQLAIELKENTDGAGQLKTYLNTKLQTALQADAFGGKIQAYNKEGFNTSQMAHLDDGRGIMEIGTKTGTKVARMTSNTDGSGYLGIDNTDNSEVVRLTANTGKGGGIGIRNALKNDIITMSQNANHGLILIYNSTGMNTTAIGHSTEGHGKFEIGMSTGKKIARLQGFAQGGYLGLDNSENKEVFIARSTDDQVGSVTLRNQKGNDILRLSHTMQHGAMTILNEAGLQTSYIGHLADGRGLIETGSKEGKRTVRLTANTDGTGYIGVDNNTNLEVVRITANNGQGGRIGIRNNAGSDIIQMSQADQYGHISLLNPSGKILTSLGHSLAGGAFIGTKDQNGKDAIWLQSGETGGGHLFTFNDQNQLATSLSSASGRGRVAVYGLGIERARLATTNTGEGAISIDNLENKSIAGLTNNPLNSGGYVYVNNKTGKELARLMISSDDAGSVTIDGASGTNLAGMVRNTVSGGGYLFAKNNAGKDVARVTSTANGNGVIAIDNSNNITVAGLNLNSSNGGGYLFANGSDGKEIATITNTNLGNGYMSVQNKTGTVLAGLTMGNASAGGYVFANHSNGKDVARLSSLAGGSGYLSIDNQNTKTVSYVTTNTNNDGYIGIANAAGNDRARITAGTNGGGYISISNPSGREVVELTTTAGQHGNLYTYNSSGAAITAHLATAAGHGYLNVSNQSGNERSYMGSGSVGGEIGVKDLNGKNRVTASGGGNLEVTDADGSYASIYSTGAGASMLLVDRLQHPRAKINPGYIAVQGPNGVDNSFVGSVNGSPHLGYIGVCNSAIVNSPVEAGMFVNGNGQGVLFADIKNFKADYPGQPDKQIWYGSLEGPELAAYIRGTAKLNQGKTTVLFDDHFLQMANLQTMTVILTPLSGKSKGLAVVKKGAAGFEVEELWDGQGDYEFDWEVKAVRKGHEDFEPVRKKSDSPVFLSSGLSIISKSTQPESILPTPRIRESIKRSE